VKTSNLNILEELQQNICHEFSIIPKELLNMFVQKHILRVRHDYKQGVTTSGLIYKVR
jgi:hypothetical protein